MGYWSETGSGPMGPSATRVNAEESAPTAQKPVKLPKVKARKQQNGTYEATLRDGLPKVKPTAYTGKD